MYVVGLHDRFREYMVVSKPFYTFDHDTSSLCSAKCGSGWWYDHCTQVNLNAPFHGTCRDSYTWDSIINDGRELQSSTMFIKRNE